MPVDGVKENIYEKIYMRKYSFKDILESTPGIIIIAILGFLGYIIFRIGRFIYFCTTSQQIFMFGFAIVTLYASSDQHEIGNTFKMLYLFIAFTAFLFYKISTI